MQSTERPTKAARINIRVRGTVKDQAEAAARVSGLSMSQFAEAAISQKAEAVLSENARIALSERDFLAFVAATESEPAAPSSKLLKAVEEFNQLRAQHPDRNL